jgi:hypothetical protein
LAGCCGFLAFTFVKNKIRVVRKLQFSQAESSLGLITKPKLDYKAQAQTWFSQLPFENAKRQAFCRDLQTNRRLADDQPGRANKPV